MGSFDLDLATPQLDAWDDSIIVGRVDRDGNEIYETSNSTQVTTITYQNQGIYVNGNTAQLIYKGKVGDTNWRTVFEALPGSYEAGISQLHLKRLDYADVEYSIVGTFVLNPLDETKITINWDADSLPDDTAIVGPNGTRTNIDYIIDPLKFNPSDIKVPGLRILLLGNIGNNDNQDGPDAWKNNDGTDFIAEENDIIEWSGTYWEVVFDASANDSATDIVYTTNLNTGKQYRWNREEWLLSVDGEYPRGTWRLQL